MGDTLSTISASSFQGSQMGSHLESWGNMCVRCWARNGADREHCRPGGSQTGGVPVTGQGSGMHPGTWSLHIPDEMLQAPHLPTTLQEAEYH